MEPGKARVGHSGYKQEAPMEPGNTQIMHSGYKREAPMEPGKVNVRLFGWNQRLSGLFVKPGNRFLERLPGFYLFMSFI
jgi:hypothetical protein